MLSHGFWYPFLGLVIAAVICHFLFYLVPGLLGMKTGLPLYVVGTSTYGASGGLYMPGLLMGLLQFGWLGVNACAVAGVLCILVPHRLAPRSEAAVPGWWHGIIAAVFVVLAAFVGLKGIQYVARVATYLPLIPVVVLSFCWQDCGGLGSFDRTGTALAASQPDAMAAEQPGPGRTGRSWGCCASTSWGSLPRPARPASTSP